MKGSFYELVQLFLFLVLVFFIFLFDWRAFLLLALRSSHPGPELKPRLSGFPSVEMPGSAGEGGRDGWLPWKEPGGFD